MAWQENAAITAKEKDSAKYYTDMFHIILCLQAAACCAVVAGAPILFKLLVKGSYEEAYYQIPILCYAIFFSSLATFLGGIYVAFKATKNVGVTTICAAAVNLVVNLGLINFIGLYAASISTFVSYLVLFLFRAFNIQKLIKITFQIKQILLMNVFICVEIVLCHQQTLLCNVINAVIAAMVIVIFNRPILVGMMNSVSKIFKKLKKGA